MASETPRSGLKRRRDGSDEPGQFADMTYAEVRSNDMCLDQNLPAPPAHRWLQSSPRKRSRTAAAPLSRLECLPTELLHAILPRLDLRTLVRLRRVSRRLCEITASLPQLDAITRHAPNALRGPLAIATAGQITCQALFDTLGAAECKVCGRYGSYLYLVTCRRVCYLCLSEHPDFLPLRRWQALLWLGLGQAAIESLPAMRSLPGRYARNGVQVRDAIALVDTRAALDAAIAQHGSFEAMGRYVIAQRQKVKGRLRIPMPPYRVDDTLRGKASDPFAACELWNTREARYLRFLAVVRVPWLDGACRPLRVDWGFHCQGCRGRARSDGCHFWHKYTLATFATHIAEHGPVQDGKHVDP